MSRLSIGLVAVSVALVLGCGSTKIVAPRELLDARAAYNRAATGPAAQYASEDLAIAKKSLQRAEQWNAQDSTAPQTRTQAYLALRRAQTAQALGEAGAAAERRARAETALVKVQELALAATSAELQRTRSELTELQRSESARDDDAMAALERQGARREARGEVITLPRALLFATGQSELSGAARARLDDIAAALRRTPNKIVAIEGYTDDTGTDTVNQPLSEARARAVGDYLASRGVSSDKIQIRGYGSTRPIASNGTEQGRASNRRVEIIVPLGVTEPMPNSPATKP